MKKCSSFVIQTEVESRDHPGKFWPCTHHLPPRTYFLGLGVVSWAEEGPAGGGAGFWSSAWLTAGAPWGAGHPSDLRPSLLAASGTSAQTRGQGCVPHPRERPIRVQRFSCVLRQPQTRGIPLKLQGAVCTPLPSMQAPTAWTRRSYFYANCCPTLLARAGAWGSRPLPGLFPGEKLQNPPL